MKDNICIATFCCWCVLKLLDGFNIFVFFQNVIFNPVLCVLCHSSHQYEIPSRRSSSSSILDPTDLVSVEHDIPNEDSCSLIIKTEQHSEDENEAPVMKCEILEDQSPPEPDEEVDIKTELEDVVVKSEPTSDLHCDTQFNKNLDSKESLNTKYCGICKTHFQSKTELTDHLKIHSDEKVFICYICDRVFGQKGNMKQHIMTHSNNRPFKCDVCQKGFNQEGNLIIHKRYSFLNLDFSFQSS